MHIYIPIHVSLVYNIPHAAHVPYCGRFHLCTHTTYVYIYVYTYINEIYHNMGRVLQQVYCMKETCS